VLGSLFWGFKSYEQSVGRSQLLTWISRADDTPSACQRIWETTGLYRLTEKDMRVVCDLAKAAVVEHPVCGLALDKIRAEWARRGNSYLC